MPVPVEPTRGLTRRASLVAAGAAVAVTSTAPAHGAGARFRVARYGRTTVPRTQERHMLNRFGMGFSPSGLRQLRKAGGPVPWLELQMRPERIIDTKVARALPSWYPNLKRSPRTKWDIQSAGGTAAWEYARDLGNLTLLRRAYSNRPVLERMTDFWASTLHIPASGDLCWMHRADYEEVLRRNAFSSFEKILHEASLHPAMLLYLDTWRSTADATVENHGRELLELHTVGVGAGYTEDMMRDSAKILSGWTIDAYGSWNRFYDRDRHATGRVKVLGFEDANRSTDGRALCDRYLTFLAHHPATAENLCRKLAVYFVSDNPSEALVQHLVKVYLANKTQIRPVLRALANHRQFKRSADAKLRTHHDDLVATLRVLGPTPYKNSHEDAFAHTTHWSARGVSIYQWPDPAGPPLTSESYATAARMLQSMRNHWALAGGYWPTKGAKYRSPAAFFPQSSLPFAQLVDHLSRVLLGRESTPRLLQVACEATGIGPKARVTRNSSLGSWLGIRLIAAILDTPEHLSR